MYHAASEVTRVPLVDGPRKSMETQSMRLQSVRIQRFKRIKDASIDLNAVNVFVGGNNSGKSSLIQALHFGVGLLQTIALSGQWKASTSLNPTQLIYSPAEDIHALGPGGKLFENENEAIALQFNLASGDSCSVNVRKGQIGRASCRERV